MPLLPEDHCENCNGTGEVCAICLQPKAKCPGPNFNSFYDPVECPDCYGSGTLEL